MVIEPPVWRRMPGVSAGRPVSGPQVSSTVSRLVVTNACTEGQVSCVWFGQPAHQRRSTQHRKPLCDGRTGPPSSAKARMQDMRLFLH